MNIKVGNFIVIGGIYNEIVKWAENNSIGLYAPYKVIKIGNQCVYIEEYNKPIPFNNIYSTFNTKQKYTEWLEKELKII